MKILHILLSPRSEGTPRLVLDWLTVQQYKHEVLFLNESPNDLLEDFQKTDAKLYFKGYLPEGKRKIPHMIRMVKKVAKKSRPDTVIAWNQGYAHWLLLGAKTAGVKLLIAHGGNPPHYHSVFQIMYNWLSAYTLKAIGAKMVCCSRYLVSEFNKIPLIPKSVFYSVYNCTQVSKFMVEKKEKTYDVVMVATMESHKDHTTLLKAWKNVQSANQDAALALAGEGSLMEDYKKLSEELGLRNVYFLGSVNNVPELLSQCEIFVLSTTKQEGFGTVLVEALAAGMQIIASDVPACREVLKNGMYGKLVRRGSAEDLFNALTSSINNPINENIIQIQKSYSQQFSPEMMIENYLKIAAK